MSNTLKRIRERITAAPFNNTKLVNEANKLYDLSMKLDEQLSKFVDDLDEMNIGQVSPALANAFNELEDCMGNLVDIQNATQALVQALKKG